MEDSEERHTASKTISAKYSKKLGKAKNALNL
jgi:hypothetical protein